NDAAVVDADLKHHLEHLEVQRRLAPRTLALYRDAFVRLQHFAADAKVPLRAVQVHHVRRWAATLHGRGLGPRSIALVLSAWRGLYRGLGRDGAVASNPVEGVRAPKAAKPLPKARAVDQAMALVEPPRGAAACRRTCIRTCCATRSRATCCNPAATCAACRSCWATRTSRPRRSTRSWTSAICRRCTTRLTREQSASDESVAMKVITLRDGKERSLERRHPWVFESSVASGK